MIVLDANALIDIAAGDERFKQAITPTIEQQEWAVPALALYETFLGSFYGGDLKTAPRNLIPTIEGLVTVLSFGSDTAVEAIELHDELRSIGHETSRFDILIAAHAREHNAAFFTADEHFWAEDVKESLKVVEYHREQN